MITITTTIKNDAPSHVWVAVLQHEESSIWREYREIQVFENIDDARKWAAKELHRLLGNAVGSNMLENKVEPPFSSSVRWVDNYDLWMAITDKNGKIQDQTNVAIYKKEILGRTK